MGDKAVKVTRHDVSPDGHLRTRYIYFYDGSLWFQSHGSGGWDSAAWEELIAALEQDRFTWEVVDKQDTPIGDTDG